MEKILKKKSFCLFKKNSSYLLNKFSMKMNDQHLKNLFVCIHEAINKSIFFVNGTQNYLINHKDLKFNDMREVYFITSNKSILLTP